MVFATSRDARYLADRVLRQPSLRVDLLTTAPVIDVQHG